MVDQASTERKSLEKKDKDELRSIVTALGGKASPRIRKAALIDQVLELSGVVLPAAEAPEEEPAEKPKKAERPRKKVAKEPSQAADIEAKEPQKPQESKTSDSAKKSDGKDTAKPNSRLKNGNGDRDSRRNNGRGRNRGRGREREEAGNDPISKEPEKVDGYLDLRDEGYGFLRVNGILPSRDDVYVSVKQVRQLGLRKGDQLSGLAVPAHRHEKNPCFQEITAVNGKTVEEAKARPRFEKLTPVFPTEQLVLEREDQPQNLTSRVIDLVAPVGKGQRALIATPPRTGKTDLIKEVATSLEANHKDLALLVLLIDERPEEVTAMARHLENGEVVASTFDRPAEEHTAVAELTIERAKRMVEEGQDVCVILDGITQLTKAYNTSLSTGRILAGELDSNALYPAKKLFGAARNLEESGSLTIIATAQIETGSPLDDVIYREFRNTSNSELKLDQRAADKKITPAIDLLESSTRNKELLTDTNWTAASPTEEDSDNVANITKLLEDLNKAATNAELFA